MLKCCNRVLAVKMDVGKGASSRPAEGGERVCNARIDSVILNVTKNSASG